MVQWIAILAVLVCLSDSSLSRSWFGFDENDDDDYQLGLSDPDDEVNWKSKHHGGSDSWESDEDYEDSGYGNYRPTTSNQGHHYDHNNQAFGYHNHDHHQFDHNGHDHHRFGHQYHQGHGRNDDNNYGTPDVHGLPVHNKGPSSNWGSSQHGPGEPTGGYPGQHSYNFGHPSQTVYPGHNSGSHGYPSQTGFYGQNPESRGHPSQTGSPGKPTINSGSPPRDLPQNNASQQGSGNDADRVVFPDSSNQVTTTGVPPTLSAQPVVTTGATTTTTTTTTDRSLLVLDLVCVRGCPATAEYNPVCGTNNVTYSNPGVLQCARNCGLNVTIARHAPCPRLIPHISSTISPITNPPSAETTTPVQTTTTETIVTSIVTSTVKPTQFANADVNPADKPVSTSIPLDVLQSIFGKPTPINSDINKPQ